MPAFSGKKKKLRDARKFTSQIGFDLIIDFSLIPTHVYCSLNFTRVNLNWNSSKSILNHLTPK